MEEVEHCELFARRVAATCHTVDTSGMRVVGGWQIKINAILQSKNQNIIYMDADNIVAADPTYLFDSEEFQKNDILLWSDNPRIDDYHGFITAHQWARVGLDRTDKALDVETGQMVINKHRAWKALHIIKHFADRADYWEGFNGGETGVWYGDKTSFHMGCILAGIDFHTEKWNKFDGGGFFAHTGLNGVCCSNMHVTARGISRTAIRFRISKAMSMFTRLQCLRVRLSFWMEQSKTLSS